MGVRDGTGFDEFVADRSRVLLRTALLLTGDRGHAEHLLQAALVKAYRRWDGIGPEARYAYVRRILVTSAASWRRLRVTQEIVALPPSDPAGSDPADDVAERDDMRTALATLPRRMRAVLVLRYAEGLGEAATAAALGCSVSTVRSQTQRGLARLRTVLTAPAPTAVLE